MNEVLKKCVDELGKDQPQVAYVRGMLETLLAMSGLPQAKPSGAMYVGDHLPPYNFFWFTF